MSSPRGQEVQDRASRYGLVSTSWMSPRGEKERARKRYESRPYLNHVQKADMTGPASVEHLVSAVVSRSIPNSTHPPPYLVMVSAKGCPRNVGLHYPISRNTCDGMNNSKESRVEIHQTMPLITTMPRIGKPPKCTVRSDWQGSTEQITHATCNHCDVTHSNG